MNNGSGDSGSCFGYRGMDGYSEADGYGNSKTWRLKQQVNVRSVDSRVLATALVIGLDSKRQQRDSCEPLQNQLHITFDRVKNT